MSRLGDEIQRRRIARGWRVYDLATRVGVWPVTIAKWERGWARPRPANCGRLVEELGFTYPELAELDRASDEGDKP